MVTREALTDVNLLRWRRTTTDNNLVAVSMLEDDMHQQGRGSSEVCEEHNILSLFQIFITQLLTQPQS